MTLPSKNLIHLNRIFSFKLVILVMPKGLPAVDLTN